MATADGALPQAYEESSLWTWLTTVDHKKIAVLYGVSGFIFLLVGGLEALTIRTQLAVPNGTVVDADRQPSVIQEEIRSEILDFLRAKGRL